MSNFSGLIRDRLSKYFEDAPHGAKTEFCRKTGIHPQNLKNWLSGRAIPLDDLSAVANGLGTTPYELLRPAETAQNKHQPVPSEKTNDARDSAIVGEMPGGKGANAHNPKVGNVAKDSLKGHTPSSAASGETSRLAVLGYLISELSHLNEAELRASADHLHALGMIDGAAHSSEPKKIGQSKG